MNIKSNDSSATALVIPPPVETPRSVQWWQSLGSGLTLLFLVCVLTTACQQQKAAWPSTNEPGPSLTGNAPIISNPVSSPATQLREGDVIQVAFESETNLNTIARIQLDGSMVLPMIGSVPAAGLTLQALQADLQKRYEKLIKITELTVTLNSTSACVYVSGAVLHPGRIALDRPLTVLEAIMEAGGFDLARAKPSDVTVVRMENGKQRSYRLNMKAALREGNAHPFSLHPFDIVHVPEKMFNF